MRIPVTSAPFTRRHVSAAYQLCGRQDDSNRMQERQSASGPYLCA